MQACSAFCMDWRLSLCCVCGIYCMTGASGSPLLPWCTTVARVAAGGIAEKYSGSGHSSGLGLLVPGAVDSGVIAQTGSRRAIRHSRLFVPVAPMFLMLVTLGWTLWRQGWRSRVRFEWAMWLRALWDARWKCRCRSWSSRGIQRCVRDFSCGSNAGGSGGFGYREINLRQWRWRKSGMRPLLIGRVGFTNFSRRRVPNSWRCCRNTYKAR